jgi:hypothetical protein
MKVSMSDVKVMFSPPPAIGKLDTEVSMLSVGSNALSFLR